MTRGLPFFAMFIRRQSKDIWILASLVLLFLSLVVHAQMVTVNYGPVQVREANVIDYETTEQVSSESLPETVKHSVYILYCQASGNYDTFVKARKYLDAQFPDRLDVTGNGYPVPPVVQVLLVVLQLLQFLTMACIIFGDAVWTTLLRWVRRTGTPPAIYTIIRTSYAIPYCIVIFFIMPKVLDRYVHTNAFEVFLDGTLVFSALDTGRLPQARDLVEPLLQAGLIQI